MASWITEATTYVQTALAEQADPEKAAGMQAYMKTDMPFYGVQKPGRVPIARVLVKSYPPTSRDDYERLVLALWRLPHREEKYIAQAVAVSHHRFIVPASLPLYRRFVVEGAWWDFVDEASTHMIRELVLEDPAEVWPTIDSWISDDNMWLRRSSIICQVGAKERTHAKRLFSFCEQRAFEKEFFIRKAIGWALREYSKTNGEAVAHFVTKHREILSGLSYREATKHIGDLVVG
jgi:3-methyladenine DNA glycosylase AlkD